MSALRPFLMLGLLVLLPTPAWAVQQGDACEGDLWRKVEAWLEPSTTFTEMTGFLRGQSIDYAVRDARPWFFDAFVDEQIEPNPALLDATDCQPRDEAPNCSIVTSEPRPENKSTFASLSDLANVVQADELISIDFDAEGKLIAHECSVVLTGS